MDEKARGCPWCPGPMHPIRATRHPKNPILGQPASPPHSEHLLLKSFCSKEQNCVSKGAMGQLCTSCMQCPLAQQHGCSGLQHCTAVPAQQTRARLKAQEICKVGTPAQQKYFYWMTKSLQYLITNASLMCSQHSQPVPQLQQGRQCWWGCAAPLLGPHQLQTKSAHDGIFPLQPGSHTALLRSASLHRHGRTMAHTHIFVNLFSL